MNPVEIEETVSTFGLEPFDRSAFQFRFLVEWLDHQNGG